ncbi:hypothetical protein [Candidatus Methanomethylophilus sp. 1R26]|nr:hypothetical protein [Candidatus Methanomethylophilus sp. 1R26]
MADLMLGAASAAALSAASGMCGGFLSWFGLSQYSTPEDRESS